jgi:hypothetical protein
MKYVAIALLVFLISVAAAFVNEIGLFNSSVQPQSDWFGNVDQAQIAGQEYNPGTVSDTGVDFGFGDFVKGLWYFIKAVGLAIVGIPYILASFGLKSPFIYIMSVPVYLIYIIGIAQFISNRGLKGMT